MSNSKNGANASKENKTVTSTDVLNQINANRAKLGLDKVSEKPIRVGQNGMAIGDKLVFTGVIDLAHPIKDDDGKITNSFIALQYNTDQWISLRKVMGTSSPRGFKFNEVLISEFGEDKEVRDHHEIDTTLSADMVTKEGKLAWDKVVQPHKRELYEEVAFLQNNPSVLENLTLYYKGTMGKPFTASKDPENSYEEYRKGYKRVISVALFSKAK